MSGLPQLGRSEGDDDQTSDFPEEKSDADAAAFMERMKVLLENVGGPGELARKAGVSRRVIDKYRGGESDPSRSRLVRLARAGGVSLEWLATGKESERPAAQGAAERGVGLVADAGDRYVRIPRFDVRAAAGAGAVVESEEVIEHVIFEREYLRLKLGASPQNLALIEAHGDSMAETIQSGDLLLVDTSVPRVRGDGIYVIRIDGSLLVKRLVVRLDGGVHLKSDNPRYDVIEVPKRDLATLRIVGRVVWVGGEV